MPQFSVYANSSAASRERVPYLLDVQSDLLGSLATSIVVPLCPAHGFGAGLISTLMPVLTVGDQDYVMLTPELTGIARRELGPEAASLWEWRHRITAALELALSGF